MNSIYENLLLKCMAKGDLETLEQFVRRYENKIDELTQLNAVLSQNFWSPEISILPTIVEHLKVGNSAPTRVAIVRLCVFSVHSSEVLCVCTDSRLPSVVLSSPRLNGMSYFKMSSTDPKLLAKRIGEIVKTPGPNPPLRVIQNSPYTSC